MKIYARQIAPEYQDGYYLLEGLENIEVFGNRHFRGITSAFFDRLPAALEELAAVWDNMQNGYYNGVVWADELREVLPPQGRPEYTRQERAEEWPRILNKYTEGSTDQLCAALDLITGRRWEYRTLRGCCQGDWQYCIYAADKWSADGLERLEAVYFNTGTEWIVHDSENAPESPEDIEGYSIYCTAWNDDGIKKEISEAAGGRPEEVKLYKFESWARRAVYMEV